MNKQDLSKRFSDHWRECAEYAKILGVPKNEVHMHFKIIKKYEGRIVENKDVILTEMKRGGFAMNSRSKDDRKADDFELMDDFKVVLWTIKKVGGLERAEKLFQAAKLVIESNREKIVDSESESESEC